MYNVIYVGIMIQVAAYWTSFSLWQHSEVRAEEKILKCEQIHIKTEVIYCESDQVCVICYCGYTVVWYMYDTYSNGVEKDLSQCLRLFTTASLRSVCVCVCVCVKEGECVLNVKQYKQKAGSPLESWQESRRAASSLVPQTEREAVVSAETHNSPLENG